MEKKPLSAYSIQQLEGWVTNYKKKNTKTGGIYPLSEILIELRNRIPTEHSAEEIFKKILVCSANSPDNMVTYLELWNAFNTEQWQGNNSQRIVMNMMGKVIGYCVSKNLPIITTLIVRTDTRQHKKEAVQNIFEECLELGMNLSGVTPAEFCATEKEKAIALAQKHKN